LNLKKIMLPFSLLSGLCLPIVSHAAPEPMQPSPPVTVQYGGSTYTISSVYTSYTANPDIFTAQPWWGNSDLSFGLAQLVGDAGNLGVFLLFGYGIENGFVSIDYYIGPDVSHCPSGCPSVDDSYDYAIISELVTLASLSNSLQSTSLGLSSLNSGLI